MPSKEQIELSKYRLEKSNEMIEESIVLLDTNHYKGSNNRSYYSILHAMRAMLALEGFDSKKHSGVISEFQRLFVKTQIFEREYSKIIMTASEIRNASDYDDYYIASKDEAEKQLDSARRFNARVSEYIQGKTISC